MDLILGVSPLTLSTYIYHHTRWLAFTKIHALSQYLPHLEERLGQGTDVEKLFLKSLWFCLDIWMLIVFHICMQYQDTARRPLCTKVA